ncbi:MAG: Rab family GTPase [Candidatus Hermodarchaeota archaeon]
MSLDELNFKVVLLGEPAVGKTSLIRQFVEKAFSEEYISTLGVDFSTKDVNLPKISDKPIKLTLWDVAGHTRFATYQKVFLTGAQGAMLVFDLTRPNTYGELQRWAQTLKQYAPKSDLIILANKKDLTPSLDISTKLEQLKTDLNADSYYLTSAKTGEGVEEAFHTLASLIYEQVSRL